MIRQAPTTATQSGLWPARMAGRTNSSSTTKLRPSAASAASPRQRPSASTAAANSPASHHSDPLALEVHHLVGAGVVGVAARPGQHHLVADREPRRAGLDGDELHEIAARPRPVGHVDDERDAPAAVAPDARPPRPRPGRPPHRRSGLGRPRSVHRRRRRPRACPAPARRRRAARVVAAGGVGLDDLGVHRGGRGRLRRRAHGRTARAGRGRPARPARRAPATRPGAPSRGGQRAARRCGRVRARGPARVRGAGRWSLWFAPCRFGRPCPWPGSPRGPVRVRGPARVRGPTSVGVRSVGRASAPDAVRSRRPDPAASGRAEVARPRRAVAARVVAVGSPPRRVPVLAASRAGTGGNTSVGGSSSRPW